MHYLSEAYEQKWGSILDHPSQDPIDDPWKRAVTAVVLENTQQDLINERQAAQNPFFLTEDAPTNSTGAAMATYDPILISLVRRSLPNLIAYDVCSVQPMTGPTGLIFAMKSRYINQTGDEALFNEANTFFTSTNAAGANGNTTGSATNTNPVFDLTDASTYGVGSGMTTAVAEGLGNDTGNEFAEVAVSIDKVTVTAHSRALKAEYTMELAQDMKVLHGLDIEVELSNVVSTELLTEINREIIRHIYRSATVGAQWGTTTAGTFNLDTDSNGRWMVERFKGLVMHIEQEANAIGRATRRGKGNILIVSSDVASALDMAGVLSYTPNLKANLTVDDTGNTYAGMLHNRIKVFIDPYFGGASSNMELAVVGYKGSSPYDAGLFYCPYVPLQMVRAIGQNTFQPKIGFKTRYGVVANPFATTAGDGVVGNHDNAAQANIYYRIFKITNLM